MIPQKYQRFEKREAPTHAKCQQNCVYFDEGYFVILISFALIKIFEGKIKDERSSAPPNPTPLALSSTLIHDVKQKQSSKKTEKIFHQQFPGISSLDKMLINFESLSVSDQVK